MHDPKYPETELHVHVTRYYYLSNNAKGRPGEIARCDGLFESHKGEIWMYNTFMWRPERVRTGMTCKATQTSQVISTWHRRWADRHCTQWMNVLAPPTAANTDRSSSRRTDSSMDTRAAHIPHQLSQV